MCFYVHTPEHIMKQTWIQDGGVSSKVTVLYFIAVFVVVSSVYIQYMLKLKLKLSVHSIELYWINVCSRTECQDWFVCSINHRHCSLFFGLGLKSYSFNHSATRNSEKYLWLCCALIEHDVSSLFEDIYLSFIHT